MCYEHATKDKIKLTIQYMGLCQLGAENQNLDFENTYLNAGINPAVIIST